MQSYFAEIYMGSAEKAHSIRSNNDKYLYNKIVQGSHLAIAVTKLVCILPSDCPSLVADILHAMVQRSSLQAFQSSRGRVAGKGSNAQQRKRQQATGAHLHPQHDFMAGMRQRVCRSPLMRSI